MVDAGRGRGTPVVFDRDTTELFLFYGFLPRADPAHPFAILGDWWPPHPGRHDATGSTLVRRGVHALRAAVRECAAHPGTGGAQVVFLSGGLDSRALLGGLLDCFDSSQVVAATFGLPGELDYDLGALVARRVGVRHETLETFSVDWSTEGLMASVLARRWPMPYPFGQRYLSYCLHRRIGRDNDFWDGLTGDIAAGAVFGEVADVDDWDSAVANFVRGNQVPGAGRLVRTGFRPAAPLPKVPLCPPELLSCPDQLSYAVRQTCYTGTRLLSGYVTRTPFLSAHWLDFMLRVPAPLRKNKHLYKEILTTAFPRLFSLPGTTGAGLPLTAPRWRRRQWRASRRLTASRPALARLLPGGRRLLAASGANPAILAGAAGRPDLTSLVDRNITDLHERGVVDWLDVRSVWHEHLAGADNGALLKVLLSLEINLKASDALRAQRPCTTVYSS